MKLAEFLKLRKFLRLLVGRHLIYLDMNELATKNDLANIKSAIIKWMFIFWVGQLAAMIAIAKLFFHS
jgi:hypothetical protein